MTCVYSHQNPYTHETVYIGHGTASRAYDRSYRNKRWAEFIKEFPNYTITIIQDNLTKEAAFALESDLIDKHLPICNVKLNQTLRNDIDFELMDSMFYVDEKSCSGLSWKIDNRARNPSMKRRQGDHVGSLKFQVDGRPHAWQTMVKGKSYLVHRIVWILSGRTLGTDTVIDHIDRNPFNNSITNLREVSHKDNVANSNLRRTNKTGIKGLEFDGKCYAASKRINGKRKYKNFSLKKFGDNAIEMALHWMNDSANIS